MAIIKAVKNNNSTRFNPYSSDKTARRLAEKEGKVVPLRTGPDPAGIGTGTAATATDLADALLATDTSSTDTASTASTQIETPELDAATGNTGTSGEIGWGVGKNAGDTFWDTLQATLNRLGEGVAAGNSVVQANNAAELANEKAAERKASSGESWWDKLNAALESNGDTFADYNPVVVATKKGQAAGEWDENSTWAENARSNLENSFSRTANLVSGGIDQVWGGTLNNAGDVVRSAVRADQSAQMTQNALNAQLESSAGNDDKAKDLLAQNAAIQEKIDAQNPGVVASTLYDSADIAAERGATDIAQAEEGLGVVGKLAAQALVAGTQMLGDVAVATATGGSSLIPMVIRSYGMGSQQARQTGASETQQAAAGIAVAATEYFTEKLFGGNPVYDTDAGLVNKLVSRITSNGTLMKMLASLPAVVISEGLEEVIADILEPLAQKIIYDPNASIGTIDQIISDGVVGMLLALMGISGNAISRSSMSTNTSTDESQQDTAAQDTTQTAQNGSTTVQNTQTQTTTASNPTTTLDFTNMSKAKAKSAVEQILTRGVSGVEAFQIVKSPIAKSAFESLTGNALTGTLQAQATVVMKASQDMRSTASQSAIIEAEKNYPPSTVNLTSTANNSLSTGQQTLVDALSGTTSTTTAQPSTASQGAAGATISTPLQDGGTAANVNPTEFNSQEQETAATTPVTVQTANAVGATETPAAAALTGPEVQSQTHSTDPLYSAMERTIPGLRAEDRTHTQHSDAQVDALAAHRVNADYEGEKADVFSPDTQWDDVDTVVAHNILAQEVAKAEKSGDYSEVVRLQKLWDAHTTQEGQAFRQLGRFANTPEAIIADAAETLYGEDSELRKLRPREKAGIMDTVVKFAYQYNAIQPGDTASLVDLIKQLNVARKTTGLFTKNTSKAMSSALDYMAKAQDGEAFLRDVAATQIRSIAGDYAKPSVINAVKDYRIMSILSKISTIARNLGANNVLDPLESLSNNIVVPLDTLLSKITGTRSMAVDKSWFSKAKRQGSTEGFIRSFIQEGLDANIDNVNGKYEMRTGRTFKMTGNLMERILSTWQKYENYALRSTDEFQKGGIAAETQRSIDQLKGKGLVADDALTDRANLVAQQRTLQDKGHVASAFLKGREALNNLYTATDNRGGSMGVGDLAAPFAVVPANVAAISGKYTPLGLVNSTIELANVLKKASDGTLTADEQAKAVTDVGRSITGLGMVAISTALALKGIIKVAGDDDKDKAALERAEGRTGTQFNVSALMRWIQGEDTEWQTDDTLINVGFLESINSALAMGSAIAEAYENDGTITFGDVIDANIEAIFQSVLDLPAMYTLSSAVDSYNYSNSDTTAGKLADAAISFAGNTGSSFAVPNFLRGIAQGTDSTVRNTYAGDTTASDVLANILSGIPGARETLPASINSWGQDRTYAENPFLHFLNTNILPGTVTKYQTSETNQELSRLSDSGITGIYPDRYAPYSITYDGENYQLTADERDQYLRTMGQEANQLYQMFMATDTYDELTDEQRGEVIKDLQLYAANAAKQEYLAGQGIEYESTLDKTSDLTNLPGYLSVKEAFSAATSDDAARDYSAIDSAVQDYGTMPKDVQEALAESYSRMDDLYAASWRGCDSEEWYAAYDKYKELYDNKTSGYTSTDKATDFAAWVDANYSDSKVQSLLKGQLTFTSINSAEATRYEALTSAGLSATAASEVYDVVSALEPVNGNSGVSNWQIYDAVASGGYTADEINNIFSVYMPETTYSHYQTAISEGYTARQFASFYETLYTTDAKDEDGNSVSGLRKSRVKAWALENGYTEEQFAYLWKLLS